MKPSIHGFFKSEIKDACAEMGAPGYRAGQIWPWLYTQFVEDWSGMKNLPKNLLAQLDERYSIHAASTLRMEGAVGSTQKILVGLEDGECVEAVLLPSGDRNTVCISSQVGCKFGCSFCASGKGGFVRDLSAGEMVGQVLLAAREFKKRPDNVVFMGMGEPFDNYDAVLRAARLLNDQEGLCIGARKITLSTSGVVPGLERLAGEGFQLELSVSLHAPDDDLRSRLMPVNKKYPLVDLVAACKTYTEKTHRIITFEYTLVKGLNDTVRHAEQLVKLLSGFSCRVNLIPLSPIDEFQGEAPARASSEQFMQVLNRHHINVTLRDSKGSSIKAACGQLRRKSRSV
ncbi:MAG: 23S rRNA (adenine(2503)-C(2))-methyltransferase RlmN [Lentisphaerota bacterium]